MKERVVPACRLQDVKKNQVTPGCITSHSSERGSVGCVCLSHAISPPSPASQRALAWQPPEVFRETNSLCAQCCPPPQVLLSLCCVSMAVKAAWEGRAASLQEAWLRTSRLCAPFSDPSFTAAQSAQFAVRRHCPVALGPSSLCWGTLTAVPGHMSKGKSTVLDDHFYVPV